MEALWTSRYQRVAALFVVGALGAIGFLPLFGGPGYEHSLASGLFVPSAAALATALELSAVRLTPLRSPLACVGRGIASGGVLAGFAFATALVHGLRVGLCDVTGGAAFFVLTAGFGALLGGTWGAVAGELARGCRRRRLVAIVLAVAAPLAGIAISAARFFCSPMIFAYDPFFGYFSGALYDTVIDVRPELWTYRAGSAATLIGVVFVSAALGRAPSGACTLASLRDRGRRAVCFGIGVVTLGLSLAVAGQGPALGHWQSSATIAAALGGRISGGRCDIFYPDTLQPDQAALLLLDCEQQLAADELRLGAHLRGRLSAFEFADASQKRRLMGAADTSIAKPWRHEVYIQVGAYPHPVLGHEIAHVVAGSFARGPFRVGGGLVPNPGLVEGIAVATSPDDDELTGAQWARAMRDLGTLPSVRSIFSLDFLGQNASKSYTVAGAFVGWVLDRWGSATVRAWYGGASIEALTGKPWDVLDADFRRSLDALAMPPSALDYARSKFERPSVWKRRCPHEVDALNRAADQCRDERRFDRALRLYDAALATDFQNWHARFNRAWVDMRYRNDAAGRGGLLALVKDPQAPGSVRDRAEEAVADDDLTNGRVQSATAAYLAIALRTLDEDAGRTLEVKARSASDETARRAIVDWLVGPSGRPVDPWIGALSMGVWAASDSALALYLVGKNLALHDLHDNCARAAPLLDRAIELGPPTPRVGRELFRSRVICACADRDSTALERVARRIGGDDSPFAGGSGGRREWVRSLIARCTLGQPVDTTYAPPH